MITEPLNDFLQTQYVMTPPDLYEIQAILLIETKVSPEYIVP
jgi:hypothetical protein